MGLKRPSSRGRSIRTRRFQTDPRGVEALGMMHPYIQNHVFQTDPRGVEAGVQTENIGVINGFRRTLVGLKLVYSVD